MKNRSVKLVPSALAAAVMALAGGAPLQAFAAASCTWVPSTGDWGTSGNWSCGIVPSGPPQDAASIAAGKTVGVSSAQSIFTLTNAGHIDITGGSLTLTGGGSTTNTGLISVGGAGVLNVNHALANTGGTLAIANGGVLNQDASTITGGTIAGTGTGKLVVTNSGNNFLNGTTFSGTLDAVSFGNARERIGNGMTLNGTINIGNGGIVSLDSTVAAANAIGGNGTINLTDAGARLAIDGDGTTTFGAGIVVQGQGNIGTPIYVGGTNVLTNNGRISASVAGGTLNIAQPGNGGSVVNNGTMDARNGGTLLLSSAVANGSGTISALAGSSVVQSAFGITGGNITTAATGLFTTTNSGSNVLDNVKFSGTLDMATFGNARERIANGAVINGAVNIANGGVLSLDSTLTTGGAQTLSGTAVINLNDAGARLAVEGDGSTTFGSGITIRGQGVVGQALFVGGNNTVTNNGLISSDVNGGTLNIVAPAGGGSFVNNGTLQAVNGGTLLLSTNIHANAGSKIISGAGSSVVQNGVTINGVFASSGGGNFQVSNSSANILDGVNFSGMLDATSFGNGRERIANGLTLAGSVNIGNGGVVVLDSTLSASTNAIGGAATFNLNDSGAWLAVDGNGATTIGSGVTIRGQGHFGQAQYAGGANTLTNNGLVSADVAGTSLLIQPPGNGGSFINNAKLQAINGATLDLQTSIKAAAGSQLFAAAGSTLLQDGVTLNGAINTVGTGKLEVTNSGANILDNVTLNGTLDAAAFGNGRVRIANGIVVNGAVNIANGGIVSLDSTLGATNSVGGTASFNLNDANAWLAVEGDGTTTIGAGVTIHGQGRFGQALYAGGTNLLTNNGLVSADVAGGTLLLQQPANGGTFTNAGTLQAIAGGTLNIMTNVATSGSGQIIAGDGSTVQQSAVTLTGPIHTVGSGVLLVNNSGANFLDGAKFSGTMDMTNFGNARQRIVNGGTLDGAINVGNSGVLSLDSTVTTGGAQTLGGTGVIRLNDAGARLTFEGNGATTFGTGITVRGQGSIGGALFSGGANTFTNNGMILADGGTLTVTSPANAGVLVGTGTLQANGGTLNLALDQAATQGKLVVGSAAGTAVTMNTQNLVITSDYTNAQSGSGNAYDKRAAVTGAGQIVAGGDSKQVIVGSGITGGATHNATLTIGNVRVGANSYGYAIENGGTTGPVLRGAIQTNVNGANLTDSRLSGAGVTASNFATGTPGVSTGNLAVVFTTATAGALAPLSGQVLNLTSNFGNIADQKLNIVIGSGSAAYAAAAGAIQSAPLNFGTVQVGQSVSQNLVIKNTATGAAGYVEDLNASFGSANGTGASLISGSGGLNGIVAGANSTAANGAMTVSVNTSAAGVVNGGITVNYATAGAVNGVSNGLGTAAVGSQNYGVAGTIQATANVINQASPVINTPSIAFGSMRVGAAAPTANVSITNQSVGAPQAALNASIASNGAPVTASGSFNLLAPGATSANQLTVGLNTATAGAFNGSATVSLVSDASNVGNCAPNCTMTLASQQVAVSGKVYAPAVAQVNTGTIDFGIVHKGDVVATQAVSVSNAAAAVALNDSLRGTFAGATGPFTASGSLAGVAAASTDATTFQAGLATGTAGVFSGSATATFLSHDADLADLALGTSTVTLKGQVNNYAEASFSKAAGAGTLSKSGSTYTFDLGDITLGGAGLSGSLALLNSAFGPADLLAGNFTVVSANPGFVLGGFDAFSGLAAGTSLGGFSVSFDGMGVGSYDETIVLHASGSNASGYDAAIGDTTLVLHGDVMAVAAVPEPGTWMMMFAGLIGIGAITRKRLRAEPRGR